MKLANAPQAQGSMQDAPALSAEHAAAVRDAIAAWADEPGALLEVLHAVQDRIGYVPPGAVPEIARALNIGRAEVHGVITFYPDFRQSPPGRHVVRLCRAEACQAVGARALEIHARRALGVDFHGTTADGAVTLEGVYCLGNCACGPSLMVDDTMHAQVSPARFDALMQKAREVE